MKEGKKTSSDNLFLSYKSKGQSLHQVDLDTWKAFKNGSTIAFKQIYDSSIGPLFDYAKNIVNNDELIKDSIHDLFIELWKSRKNLSDVEKINPYLMVCLRRKLITARKKLGKIHEFNSDNFQLFLLPDIHEKETADRTNIELLQEALNKLPERQKEALYLRFYNNLSCAEISEILEINSQSVYNLIHRALKLLKNWLIMILCSIFIYF